MNEHVCISADVKLGKDVKFSKFINLYGCEIGDQTKIGAFVEVQKNAKIGKNCKISSHTFICEGVTIEDNVFVGHGVTFINDRYPRAVNDRGELQTGEDWNVVPTIVRRRASIGSGSTILCGVEIGEGAIVDGSREVVRDAPLLVNEELDVVGPRQEGYVCERCAGVLCADTMPAAHVLVCLCLHPLLPFQHPTLALYATY